MLSFAIIKYFFVDKWRPKNYIVPATSTSGNEISLTARCLIVKLAGNLILTYLELCIFKRKRLFTDTVSVYKKYLTDTVSVYKKYLTDTVSVYKLSLIHI